MPVKTKIMPMVKSVFTRAIFVLLGLIIINFIYFAGKIVYTASAQGVPNLISYQGRLYDTSGNLLGGAGTNYYFRFSIYDAASGGTKLWPAGTPSTMTYQVRYGVFNAQVGDTNAGGDALTLDFNDDTYFLQVEVASQSNFSDGETLSPRQRITSAGYAKNADMVDGYHASTTPTANQVVALDGSGNLSFGTSNPVIQASNGLSLQTTVAGDINLTPAAGQVKIVSATTTQLTIGYDTNNRLDVKVSSAGAVTFDAVGSGAELIASDNFTVQGQIFVSGTATSTIAGDVNFDAGTLYVDSVNNRVGIGITSPAHTLSVNGTTNISGAVTLQSTLNITGNTTLANTSSTNLTVTNNSYFNTITATGQTVLANASTTNLTVSSDAYIGTVRSGTWNGSIISPTYGGLGFNASSVQKGGIIAGTGAGTFGILAVGNNGLCLIASSTAANGVAWSDCATASGAITNLNGLSVSSQDFATSTSGGLDLFITSVGSTHTFTLQPASGYSVPLSASTTEWAGFYATPSTRISAGTGLSWSGNTLNASNAFIGSGTNGYVARWASSTGLITGILVDNGTVAGVNATSSDYTFNIQGSSGVNPFNVASSTGDSLFNINQIGMVSIMGDVGIGTTTPYNPDGWNRVLDVSGGYHSKIITTVQDGNIQGGIYSHHLGYFGAPTGTMMGTYTDHPLSLITNSLARMIISNTGNVGIGTTTPAQTLAVAGSFRATGAFFDSSNASGTTGMLLQTTGTGTQWVTTSSLGIVSGVSSVTAGDGLGQDSTTGNLTVYVKPGTGITTSSDQISVDTNAQLIWTGTQTFANVSSTNLTVATDTYLNTLRTSGAILASSTLGVSGAVILHSTLNVQGQTSLVSVSSTNLTVSSNTYLASLNVSGAANFNSTLDVQGQTTLANASSTNLTVTSNAYFNTISATGQISLANTSSTNLTVSNNSYFNTLTATGQTILANASSTNFTVSGNSYLGTVMQGTWQGSVIAPTYGGLGFNASSVATGGLITGTGAGTFGILAVGNNGFCLTASSTASNGVAWSDCVTASGAITSLNGLTATTQTFATSTSGGLELNITSTGSVHTFALQPASGYTVPLSASTTEWSNFYVTPSTRINAGTGLTWSGNTLHAANEFTGTGITNYVARWASSTGLTTGVLVDIGTKVGIGTTSPSALFTVQATSTSDKTVLIAGIAGQTTNLFELQNAGSSQLLTIDISGRTVFTIATTTNALVVNQLGTGNIAQFQASGTPIFTIGQSLVTSEVPLAINSVGDTGIAGNLIFTNPTASYIKSDSPLYIQAGDIANNESLYLSGSNAGLVIVEDNFLAESSSTLAIVRVNQTGSGNILQLQGSGNDRLVVTTAGYVGIGSSTPTHTLAVQGVGGDIPFSVASSTGANLFIITQNGNVGIGTTTPAQTLAVVGSARVTGALYDSAASAGSVGMLLQTTGSGTQWVTTSSLGITGSLTGSGTNGLVARWTSASALSTGILQDSGTRAGVNATSSSYTFNIQGSPGVNPFNVASSSGSSIFNIDQTNAISINTGSGQWYFSSVTNSFGPSIGGGARLGYPSYGWTYLDFTSTDGLSNTVIEMENADSLAFSGATAGYRFSDGPILASSTLGVTGATSLHNTLNVQGQTTLANASTTNLTVSTNTYLNTLRTSGAILASSTLFVTGGSTFYDAVTIQGTTRLFGTVGDGSNNPGTYGMVLMTTSSGVLWVTTSSLGITGSLTGTGTNGYVARWTSASALSTGMFIDNGTRAGVNATSSSYTFNLQGSSGVDPFNIASSTGGALLTVKQNGNVGIGTTPTALLDIYKDSSATSGNYSVQRIDYDQSGSGTAGTKILEIVSNGYSGTLSSLYGVDVNLGGATNGGISGVVMGVRSDFFGEEFGTKPDYAYGGYFTTAFANKTAYGIYTSASEAPNMYGIYSAGGVNYFAGNVRAASAVLASSTLGVTGATTLHSTLNVQGQTTLANASTTNLTVSTNTYLNTLRTSGAILASSSLAVTGDTTFFGTAAFKDRLLVLGELRDGNGDGGKYGQVLMSTGTNVLWVTTSSLGIVSGGTPGGSSGQIQFNHGGVFAGDSGFTFNSSTDSVTIGGDLTVDTSTLFVNASTNRVGVGTSTPIARFSVQATAGEEALRISSSTGATLLVVDSGGNFNFDAGTLFVDVVNNRIGIGTTTPQTILDIVDPSGISTLRVKAGSSQGSNNLMEIQNVSGTNLAFVSSAGGIFTSSTLGVTGATLLHSTLNVQGQTTLANASSTNLTVSTNTYLNTLRTSGAILASSTLDVTGAASFYGANDFYGGVDFWGNTRLLSEVRDGNNSAGTYGMVLMTTSTGVQWIATSSLGISGGSLSGGTNGYVARWTSASTLSTGKFIDNGTVAGINATSSSYTFNLQGNSGVSPFNIASSTGSSLLTVNQAGYVGVGTSTIPERMTIAGNTLILQEDKPTFIGNIGASLESIFAMGDYVYGVGNNQFEIYDVSKPSSIVQTAVDGSNMDLPVSLYVSGRYAYVLSQNNSTLQIFDISNPYSIVVKDSETSGLSSPTSIYVSGAYAYVTDLGNSTLQIYDISNPNNIIVKDSITTGVSSAPQDVHVVWPYAYVVDSANAYLLIFDVSDPNNIVAKGSDSTSLAGPNSIYVSGAYAYVTDDSNDILATYNISDPDTPTFLDNISTTNPQDVFVSGNYAYVVKSDGNTFSIYDVSDQANIIAKNNYDVGTSYSVFVAGKYAYIGGDSYLTIFSLNNLTTPTLEAGAGYFGDLQVQDNAMFDNDVMVGGGLNVGGDVSLQAGLKVMNDAYINTVRVGLGSGGQAYNTALGREALNANTTGDYNTAVGRQALFLNVDGTGNTALGYAAGSYNGQSSGSYNTTIGMNALYYNQSGNHNVYIGAEAGNNVGNDGSGNIVIGYDSGDNITSGNNNIVIGYSIDVPTPTASNQLTIGNLLFGTGLDATGTTISSGMIGVGTSTPVARLAVQAAAGQEALRISSSTGATLLAVETSGNFNFDSNTLYIDTINNRVGIGTNNPQRILDVYNPSGISTLTVREGVNQGTNNLFEIQTASGSSSLVFTSTSTQQLRIYATSSGYYVALYHDGTNGNIESSAGSLKVNNSTIFSGTIKTGGGTAQNYNSFGSGTPGQGAIASNNDVYIVGDLEVDGTAYLSGGTAWTQGDFAEKISIYEEEVLPGDLIVANDLEGETATGRLAYTENSNRILGVISTSPAGILKSDIIGEPLALTGTVPVKVTIENGIIRRGDQITTSATVPGAGMKATTSTAGTVGIALEDFTSSSTGYVTILLNINNKIDTVSQLAQTDSIQDEQLEDTTTTTSSTSVVVIDNSTTTIQVVNNNYTYNNTQIVVIDYEELGNIKVMGQAVFTGLVKVVDAEFSGRVLVKGDIIVAGDIDLSGAITTWFWQDMATSTATTSQPVELGDAVAIMGENTVVPMWANTYEFKPAVGVAVAIKPFAAMTNEEIAIMPENLKLKYEEILAQLVGQNNSTSTNTVIRTDDPAFNDFKMVKVAISGIVKGYQNLIPGSRYYLALDENISQQKNLFATGDDELIDLINQTGELLNEANEFTNTSTIGIVAGEEEVIDFSLTKVSRTISYLEPVEQDAKLQVIGIAKSRSELLIQPSFNYTTYRDGYLAWEYGTLSTSTTTLTNTDIITQPTNQIYYPIINQNPIINPTSTDTTIETSTSTTSLNTDTSVSSTPITETEPVIVAEENLSLDNTGNIDPIVDETSTNNDSNLLQPAGGGGLQGSF